jgi:hypothetical protein
VGLLASLGGVSRLIKQGDPLPEFDFHCPLMSLPLAFETRIDSIPASPYYLASDPLKRVAWQLRLGESKRPRIGLVWSGSEHHKNDKNRSIELAELMPILPSNYSYVSVQKDIRGKDKGALTDFDIVHFEDSIGDFGDTAALCDCIDLLISVDTSVAHLAGALGKDVCLLLPYVPDWRWMLQRPDSPWYPSMKVFRQSSRGEWNFADIGSNLAVRHVR